MKKVAVIRFSALGDVAMLVPVVRTAAQQNPGIDFTVVSRLQTADLWSDMPDNVHFFGADLKGKHRGTKGLKTLLNEIGYRSFDAVADMHSVLRSWYMDFRWLMSGVKVRRIDKGRTRKRWLVSPLNHDKRQLKTTIQRYVDVLTSLNINITLPYPQTTKGEGIGVAPFAAQRGKIYPVERMEALVRKLSVREKIYLFGGGKREIETLESWAEKYDNVICVAGRHTMKEELQIIRNLRVMICMDSANMHLASLVGTRVISVWGATDPKAGFLGWGQSHEDCIYQDLPCRPCSIYGNKKCRFGDYRCLDFEATEILQRLSPCKP